MSISLRLKSWKTPSLEIEPTFWYSLNLHLLDQSCVPSLLPILPSVHHAVANYDVVQCIGGDFFVYIVPMVTTTSFCLNCCWIHRFCACCSVSFRWIGLTIRETNQWHKKLMLHLSTSTSSDKVVMTLWEKITFNPTSSTSVLILKWHLVENGSIKKTPAVLTNYT